MTTNIHFWSYVAQFFLKWETFQTKVVEKIKIKFCIQYFFFENRPVYEIMWKSIIDPDRPLMKLWRMRLTCCILKSTNTLRTLRCVIPVVLSNNNNKLMVYIYIYTINLLLLHTQNMWYLLLFHGNSSWTNGPRYYVYTYIACRFLILATGPRIGLYKIEPLLKIFHQVSILLPRLSQVTHKDIKFILRSCQYIYIYIYMVFMVVTEMFAYFYDGCCLRKG